MKIHIYPIIHKLIIKLNIIQTTVRMLWVITKLFSAFDKHTPFCKFVLQWQIEYTYS